eukprot:6890941-Prymnesium_polylepis.1
MAAEVVTSNLTRSTKTAVEKTKQKQVMLHTNGLYSMALRLLPQCSPFTSWRRTGVLRDPAERVCFGHHQAECVCFGHHQA